MKPFSSFTGRPWLSFERKIIAYFLLILLIIAGIVFIYGHISSQTKETRKWVDRSETMLSLNGSVLNNLRHIVSGTRGFIITGEESYISDFPVAAKAITDTVNRLKVLVQENNSYLQGLDSLALHLRQYFILREKQVEVRKEKNFQLEDERPLIDASNREFSSVIRILKSIEQRESNLLAQRKEAYQKSVRNSAQTLRILLLFFILSLVFAFIVIYINSLKRNRTEAALRKSEGLVRALIEHAPVLVNIKNRSGKYILVNRQFSNALLSSPEGLQGKSDFDYLSFEMADNISREFEEVLRTGQPSEIEIKLPAADGIHSYITSLFPLFDEKGVLYAVGSTWADITPVKRAHEALEKSYAQLQKVLNGLQEALSASSDLICIINEKGEFVMVSDTVRNLLGYEPREMMSKKFLAFVSEEDHARTEVVTEEIMNGQPVSDFTNHYRKKDGSIVPIIWSAKWLPQDRMMYCIARNGTELARTTKQLAKSQSRLAHAQKIARMGNWEWDLENNVLSCSDEMFNLIGLNKEEVEDERKAFYEAIHPDDRQILRDAQQEALTKGVKLDVEHRVVKPDGSECYMHTKGEVSFNTHRNPIWFSGTMQDITQRKNSELELKRLNADLEHYASQLKASNTELERFAYVASHDLQEPLRMVSSFLALLNKKLEPQLDDTSRQYIHFAVDGAERMKILIRDLLQYSRLGSTTDAFTQVDMNEVTANVLQILEPAITESQARIKADELPIVQGNRSQLTQLIQNLLANALKYRSTETPVITINCREEQKEYLFCISDNGIGIEPKFFDKIFIIFQRLHNKNEYKGTGIGLAICRKIIERHHGRIWVESEPGHGSRFYFTLKKHHHA